MSPERAWEVAGRLLPRGALSPDDFTTMRFKVALLIADYEAPSSDNSSFGISGSGDGTT